MDIQKPKKTSRKPVVELKTQDRYYDLIDREQKPDSLRDTLSMALNGELHEQGLVFNSMIDSWPRLQTDLDEVLTMVSKAPLKVEPYTEKGEEPTPEAVERAEFVEDVLHGINKTPGRSESSFHDLIQDLAMGYYTGHAVSEIYWQRDERGVTIKSTKSIPFRFFGYPDISTESDRLMLAPDGYGFGGNHLIDFPKDRFVIAVRRAHKAHASVAAPLRALTQYWLASTYGIKWLLSFAQIYGVPLRMANYVDSSDLGEITNMLQNIGSSGWGAFPAGTTVDIKEASKSAGDLPQSLLMENADRAADIFILGQSLTTDTGSSGSRALGEVHANVRLDKLQAVADFVADALTQQVVHSIMRLNYGSTDNAPEVTMKFERPKDEKALIERDRILHLEMGLPIAEDELYKRHGVNRPADGEKLFTPPTMPDGVQGEPATAYSEAHETKASKVEAKATDKAGELSDKVLEELTGVSADWLGGVKPFFDKLAVLAASDKVSDSDFVEALRSAQSQLPELFDKLNTEALTKAFEGAIGAGVISGIEEELNQLKK